MTINQLPVKTTTLMIATIRELLTYLLQSKLQHCKQLFSVRAVNKW